MNNLYQQLHQPQNLMQSNNLRLPISKSNLSLKSILNSSNPNELLQKILSQNPQLNNIMQLMQSSGKSPKDFFYQFAKSKGIDPDQFLNSITKE